MPQKILIVEDEDATARLMTLCLTKAGYEVIRARDGKAGYDTARKERPDLIILDFMLPKMDGMKVARLLRHDRDHAEIPIVFATASAPEIAQQGIDQKLADAYLPKPFEYEELIGTVSQLLARKDDGTA